MQQIEYVWVLVWNRDKAVPYKDTKKFALKYSMYIYDSYEEAMEQAGLFNKNVPIKKTNEAARLHPKNIDACTQLPQNV